MPRPRWSRDDQRMHWRRLTIRKNGITIAWCGMAIPLKAGNWTAFKSGVTCEDCKTNYEKIHEETVTP